MKPLMAPKASIPPLGVIGRITEQRGKFGLMNSHGTGKIRLVCRRGLLVALKSGKVRPFVGSVNGATGVDTPLPEKSTHSKKWHISSPPIPSVILRTSKLDTFWLRVA